MKVENFNKAVQLRSDFDHTIKTLENLGMSWFLKVFGIYKFQSWFDKKIEATRKEKYKLLRRLQNDTP